ncbi:tRNA (5-methylaminomethyl-2-thiouridine)(34)-methyltransferase MnmD [Rhizobium sp. KVB221]|uniref:tRNA (5-methylaminomethyl-2-thiouridine)(34)-methyltransferase MnmD n=1 Tax=Rhizobium setariae TaxID=2801340 RepID=A0A937CNC3_9HYPH|nr:tRNA (5-methylaminomethyl-2-thiouridine)(34)-methyltransferase MnmD [Rhizobium setariae]MBL0371018.1 tRNA (5-methylaminomethyl-2-thiouridine)(34)-methyltransferase MnmD [Rhizobium setariae]
MDKGSNTSQQPILEWIDGDMPYSTAFGDHFYCREDGRAECGHVFLTGNGLPDRWSDGAEFSIGELGFGTGLNFCETWRVWKDVKPEGHLHFTSFELYPMDRDSIAKALSRWPEIEAEKQALIARWPDTPMGEVRLEMADDVTLTVVCGDALASLGAWDTLFDAWYLDGFAPSRNADMWSEELMRAVFDHTRQGGSFATYAAAGFVRRNLIAAGFDVSRPPGFAGKREMLSGIKR